MPPTIDWSIASEPHWGESLFLEKRTESRRNSAFSSCFHERNQRFPGYYRGCRNLHPAIAGVTPPSSSTHPELTSTVGSRAMTPSFSCDRATFDFASRSGSSGSEFVARIRSAGNPCCLTAMPFPVRQNERHPFRRSGLPHWGLKVLPGARPGVPVDVVQ